MSGNVSRFLSILTCALFVVSCNQVTNDDGYYHLNNKTMGTEYNIVLKASLENKTKIHNQIDSLLNEIEDATSVYRKDSYISRINKASSKTTFEINTHFLDVYNKASLIFNWSNGSYDPTVMPIVRHLGFADNSESNKEHIQDAILDSLLQCVGLNKLELTLDSFQVEINKTSCQELDFGAIAKGYAVDQVAELLIAKGIENFLVEIGGETRSKGQSENGKNWRIGIDSPDINKGKSKYPFVAIYNGEKSAMATSGNYRNFFIKDGKKYVHTIDPKTGRSIISDVLSATILHGECAMADGLATACMVMGSELCLDMINELPEAEALLVIFESDSTFIYKSSENGLEGFEILN